MRQVIGRLNKFFRSARESGTGLVDFHNYDCRWKVSPYGHVYKDRYPVVTSIKNYEGREGMRLYWDRNHSMIFYEGARVIFNGSRISIQDKYERYTHWNQNAKTHIYWFFMLKND